VKWNEVTWYSRLIAILVFFGFIPVVSFIVGVQYQAVSQLFTRPVNEVIVVEKKITQQEEEDTTKYDLLIPSEYLQSTLEDDWSLYADADLQFSFMYPSSWKVSGNLHTSRPYIRIENRSASASSTSKYYKFEIVRLGKGSTTSLSQWLDDKDSMDEYNPKITDVVEMAVAGYPAVERTQIYMGKFGGKTLYVDKGAEIYEIVSNSADKEAQAISERLFKSFIFYDNE
jgi:hypothetical protein